jgi:hypothetical protein
MRAAELDIGSLVLDPNNYRLQDEQGFRVTPPERFHLEPVQRATYQRLRATGLKELHDSIVANGFLPIERIVVTPCGNGSPSGSHLVIEGNRRVAALKQIADEISGGVEMPQSLVECMERVPCLIVEADEGGSFFKETLMGIRHVGGIKEWGGYQRAKLIADLRDVHGLDPSDVAAKLGLSTREVNRRYRAFKALQQMRDDDEFGDLAEPGLYPLFHEAIAGVEIREWLRWNQETSSFDDAGNLHVFYGLITPSTPEDGGSERAPKLRTFSDVRQLKNVLPNPDARRYLLDPERPFLDALTIANREELSKKWRNELTEATASLEGIGALEVRNFSVDDVALLDRLANAVSQIKEVYQAVHRA